MAKFSLCGLIVAFSSCELNADEIQYVLMAHVIDAQYLRDVEEGDEPACVRVKTIRTIVSLGKKVDRKLEESGATFRLKGRLIRTKSAEVYEFRGNLSVEFGGSGSGGSPIKLRLGKPTSVCGGMSTHGRFRRVHVHFFTLECSNKRMPSRFKSLSQILERNRRLLEQQFNLMAMHL